MRGVLTASAWCGGHYCHDEVVAVSRLRFSFKITPDPPDIVEKIGALRVGVTSFIGGYSLLVGMFLSSTDFVQDVVSVGGWQVVQLGLGGISILATFVSLVLLTRSASSARAKGRLRGNLLLESLQVGWRPALGFFFPAGILIWALVQGEMAGLVVTPTSKRLCLTRPDQAGSWSGRTRTCIYQTGDINDDREARHVL